MAVIWNYWDFKDKMSATILKSKQPTIDYIFDQAVSRYDIEPDIAAEYVERFMFDINRCLGTLPPEPAKKHIMLY